MLTRADIDALNAATLGAVVPARTQVQPFRVSYREYQRRGHVEVDEAIDRMLVRIAELRSVGNVIGAAAYLAWRLPWLHMYRDGNGRASRAAAYLVLRAGVPGLGQAAGPTVPERIERTHAEYIAILNPAHDGAWQCAVGYRETVDLAPLERYLARLVADQLAGRP